MSSTAFATAVCCRANSGEAVQTNSGKPSRDAAKGLIHARPGAQQVKSPLAAGLHTIPVAGGRNSLLYIPEIRGDAAKLPLAVSLHGAGGDARRGLSILEQWAGRHSFCVLAPASRRETWDFIAGGYGPDVAVLDETLSHVFDKVNVRPGAIAISGFSDGASYALGIGIANGELFRDILAFSPGFMSPPARRGAPRIFVSHGTSDAILPVDRSSRVIVPRLRGAGYDVECREFDGPHTIPPDIKDRAIRRWLDSR